jgi:hypothetical protein
MRTADCLNPMRSVDSAVLDFTERMCRRFQTWTGRTNVWLAFQLTNLSIVIYFIWVAALYWLSADLAVRVFVALFCGAVFYLLTWTLFRTSIEVAESDAYRRVAKGFRNPRRIRDAQLRIAFLTLSILLSYPLWFVYVTRGSRFVLLTEALTILTTVVLYVLACDPLPPCTGKVRVRLGGMTPAHDANEPLTRGEARSSDRPAMPCGPDRSQRRAPRSGEWPRPAPACEGRSASSRTETIR